MKLKELEAAETGRLHLRGVDGKLLYHANGVGAETAVVAVLYGPGTPQGERLAADISRSVLREMGARGLVEDDQDRHAELLAGATLVIEGLEVPEGVAPKDFYKAVYANPRLGYLRHQVEQFQASWVNFPPASSPS